MAAEDDETCHSVGQHRVQLILRVSLLGQNLTNFYFFYYVVYQKRNAFCPLLLLHAYLSGRYFLRHKEPSGLFRSDRRRLLRRQPVRLKKWKQS